MKTLKTEDTKLYQAWLNWVQFLPQDGTLAMCFYSYLTAASVEKHKKNVLTHPAKLAMLM